MKNFLVIVKENEAEIESLIEDNFGEYNYKIKGGVWVVAAPAHKTGADVSNLLKLGAEDTLYPGIVIQVATSYGYFDKILWDKINTWESV